MLTILEYATGVFDAMTLYVYYETLFDKRRRNIDRIWVLVSCVVAMIIYGMAIGILKGDISRGAAYFRILLSLVVRLILSFFYMVKLYERMFAVVSVSIFGIIIEDGVYYLVNTAIGMSEQLDSLPKWVFVAIEYLSSLVMMLLVLIFRSMWKRKVEIHSRMYSLLLIIIPLLSVIMVCMPVGFSLILSNPQFYILLIIFLFIMNMVNYVLLGNVLKAEELEQKNRLLDDQVTHQKQRYEQLGEAYRDIRSFMHDTKHHFHYIQECVKKKEYDVIIAHTQEAMADLESRYATVNTGCLVIDALVSNYILQAKAKHIELTTSLRIEAQRVPISDYHLAIILGNLLDNALNACVGQLDPKIVLKIQQVEKNAFAIYIANTYVPGPDDEVAKNPNEMDFIHGYGLDNVKKSVREYDGIMEIKHEKDMYSVAIVFPFDALHYIRPL